VHENFWPLFYLSLCQIQVNQQRSTDKTTSFGSKKIQTRQLTWTAGITNEGTARIIQQNDAKNTRDSSQYEPLHAPCYCEFASADSIRITLAFNSSPVELRIACMTTGRQIYHRCDSFMFLIDVNKVLLIIYYLINFSPKHTINIAMNKTIEIRQPKILSLNLNSVWHGRGQNAEQSECRIPI